MKIEAVAPHRPDAAAILRSYLREIAERYNGRPMPEAELDELLLEEHSDDLEPPTGLLLLARDEDGTVVGCVGLRWLDPRMAELTRMYVPPAARRRGIASGLIAAVEDEARQRGATVMRLDTRGDLVEARALYPKHGYVEITDYNASRYADHWFEKALE